MSRPSAAHEYGRLLGTIQLAYAQMFDQIAKGIRDAFRPSPNLTPEEREPRTEAEREAAYRRRIEAERQAGLRFVRKQAAIVRRELGLPQEDDKGER